MKRVVDRIQWHRKQWAHRRLAAGVLRRVHRRRRRRHLFLYDRYARAAALSGVDQVAVAPESRAAVS